MEPTLAVKLRLGSLAITAHRDVLETLASFGIVGISMKERVKPPPNEILELKDANPELMKEVATTIDLKLNDIKFLWPSAKLELSPTFIFHISKGKNFMMLS